MISECNVFVVHDPDLRRSVARRADRRDHVIGPGVLVAGMRASAVVFVDTPPPLLFEAPSYRTWIEEHLRVRLVQNGSMVGNPLDR